jgi:hypothetical protein
MDHLDLRPYPQFSLMDVLSDLRANGAGEKLKSIRTSTESEAPRRICVQHLVPNERLVLLQAKELMCTDEDLAIIAIKFPLIQLV